ncbi:MAG: prephenate dehydratase [Candidatus Latescibacterota bacterium]|jgi:prephenate dehydratase
MSLKIAIQGIESSFHHQAVLQLFPNREIEIIACDSFEKVTESVSNFTADVGVIALENSIAGSILPNYNLIDAGNFKILDEAFLTIDMYVMALEGETIHTIDEIHSHPVALQQCKNYLMRLQPNCKIIEGKDTASEARRIKENMLTGVAAIAGKQVAEKYGLAILEGSVQNIKENKTRFVVIGRETSEVKEKVDKASMKFQLDHSVGSLSNVLQMLSTFDISLTKIQSLPIIGTPWRYAFFIDVLFKDYQLFQEVTSVLEKAVEEFKILGVYKHNIENEPSAMNNILTHEE